MNKLSKVVVIAVISYVASAQADGQQDLEVSDFRVEAKYGHIDPKHQVNQKALKAALEYFDSHQAEILNKNYITVIDFSLYSGRPRFHLVDTKSGTVESLLTAHGSGSDPNNTGFADKFSNTEGSHMSSLGPYITGETYEGSHGLSLYLDGMAPSNSKARERSIVIHGASYVDPKREKMGRSWGCPALPMTDYIRVIGLIKQKSLLYIWTDR